VDAVGVSYVVAFGGGVISFVSPCVLPVVPAYLSMVTGLDFAEAELGAHRQLARIARDTVLFIAGFGVVFVLEGLTATAIGGAVGRDRLLLSRISGGVILSMSLFIAGSLVLRAPFLYGEARFHPSASRFGPFYAPIAGVAFGFGWTPCIGPILASVLAVAATDRGLGSGAVLLLVYAAGLGVPFLLVGLGLGRLTGAIGWLKRHSRPITASSCVLLAGFGVLLLANQLSWVTTELEHAMTVVGLGRLVNVG
jgi:cytochrome c-type biogenesis protein